MISMLLGGISSPVVEAVTVSAVLKFLSKPSLFIDGIITPPTADVAAAADPEIAPKNMHAITLTYAKPPGKDDTITFAKFINLFAIPPCAMIYPDKIKKGIAKSAKLFMPVAIC